MRISFHWKRIASANGRVAGAVSLAARSRSCLKTGVSSTVIRIHRPMRTSTADSRNGIRQPYCMNALSMSAPSPATSAKMRKVPEDRKNAKATPSCGHMAISPRLPSGAYSAVSSVAPAHSPPTAKPWKKRHSTSRVGATMPMPFSNAPNAPVS